MQLFSALASNLIHPPKCRRQNHNAQASILSFYGALCDRKVVKIRNRRNQELRCIHFISREHGISGPTVVFLHGYASNCSDSTFLLEYTIPRGYSLFSFDFSGSGLSEGNCVTFGILEKFDIEAVTNYLESQNVRSIILWGFSMGATAAILYSNIGSIGKSVKGLVLNAPFLSLEKVVSDVISSKNILLIPFRAIISKILLWQMQKELDQISSLRSENVTLTDLNILSAVSQIPTQIPAFFIHGSGDKYVPVSDAIKIKDHYCSSDKAMLILQGETHSFLLNRNAMEVAFSFVERVLGKMKTPKKNQYPNLD